MNKSKMKKRLSHLSDSGGEKVSKVREREVVDRGRKMKKGMKRMKVDKERVQE